MTKKTNTQSSYKVYNNHTNINKKIIQYDSIMISIPHASKKWDCNYKTVFRWSVNVEQKIYNWYLEMRKKGAPVSRMMLLSRAKALSKDLILEREFKATMQWTTSFMRRWRISLREPTKSRSLEKIANIDEVPFYFDMIPKKTLNATGEKCVLVQSTGGEKKRFTVVFCVTGVVVDVQANAWMDEKLFLVWIQKIWEKKYSIFVEKKLLVLDTFTGHTTSDVKAKFAANGTELAWVPGGSTSLVQPLDVSLHRTRCDC